MKSIFIIAINFLLLVLSACGDKQGQQDCSRFKEGKFLLRNNYTRTKFIIERKGSIQTELNENTDTLITFRVKWVNACEYELTKISKKKKTITRPSEDRGELRYWDEIPLKVKIIATTDSYYIFEIKKIEWNRSYIDTIWKLNR